MSTLGILSATDLAAFERIARAQLLPKPRSGGLIVPQPDAASARGALRRYGLVQISDSLSGGPEDVVAVSLTKRGVEAAKEAGFDSVE